MNIGSTFRITLIADDRFEKFGTKCPKEQINKLGELLKSKILNSGIEIEKEFDERLLTGWGKPTDLGYNEVQIRKDYDMILSKKLTSNQIYRVINSVQAQPFKIYNNR